MTAYTGSVAARSGTTQPAPTVGAYVVIWPSYVDSSQDRLLDEGYGYGYTDGSVAGAITGFRDGMGIGIYRGKQEGQKKGQEAGYRSGFTVGLSAGKSTVGGGSGEGPVVEITSLPESEEDPAVITVYDAEGFSLVQVTCKDRTDGAKLVVYDDSGFQHPFSGKSTVTGTGTESDPYIFTIYRRGRWPTGVDIYLTARAIDSSGNSESAE